MRDTLRALAKLEKSNTSLHTSLKSKKIKKESQDRRAGLRSQKLSLKEDTRQFLNKFKSSRSG